MILPTCVAVLVSRVICADNRSVTQADALSHHAPPAEPGGPGPAIEHVIRHGLVSAVLQPLVHLRTREVVGYEALARGPKNTVLHRPDQLFAAAQDAGLVAELDWLCRVRAFEAALAIDLHPSLTLFVNCEPSALGSECPSHLQAVVDRAQRQLRVVTELTERALAQDPAALLAGAAASRQAGWGVAMDDVGAEPDSLAFLPFIHPDVIKLDMRLVQDRPDPQVAEIANVVMAQAERTGALILAEGIETEQHLQVALTLGATVGQGWLFGRPQPPEYCRAPATAVPVPLLSPSNAVAKTTPFDAVAARRPLTRASKELLLPMSHHLEDQLARHEGGLLLACFQEARHFTPATMRRFERFATRSPLVAALGSGMPAAPAPGVRGANLRPGDRLRGEWTVAVVGTHFAGALVSRDLDEDVSDMQRRFDFTITHDRELVLTAARALLQRIAPTN